MGSAKVWIDQDLCPSCGLCQQACGRRLSESRDGLAWVRAPKRCAQCGHCKAVCPQNAPQLAGLEGALF